MKDLQKISKKTTLNKFGYIAEQFDTFTQDFIDHAEKEKGPVLEVGCAFGNVILKLIEKGVHTFANDITQKHLDILIQNTPQDKKHLLTTLHGRFPDQVDFPEQTFSSILMGRVLHFLREEDIREGLKKAYQWIKPGGRIYIVGDTVHSPALEKYKNIFEMKKSIGDPWPGLVENTPFYIPDHFNNIPSWVNFWDAEIGKRELEIAGFKVEKSEMFTRHIHKEEMLYHENQFGAIGIKS